METKTVTKEFTLTRYRIEYKEGISDEYITTPFVETYGDFVEFKEVSGFSNVGWGVKEYKKGSKAKDVKIIADYGEYTKIKSDIVNKIEPKNQTEYVAVAEVPVSHKTVGIFSKTDSYELKDSNPDIDCTVWDKIEYEAYQESESEG